MYQQGQPAIKKDTWLILVTAASLMIAIASLVLVTRTRAELRQGITTHALVLVTPEGRMRLGMLGAPGVGRDPQELRRILRVRCERQAAVPPHVFR